MAGGAMNARLIAINEPIAWSSPPMPRLNRIHLPAVVRRIPRKATVLAIAAAFVAVNAAVPAASHTLPEDTAIGPRRLSGRAASFNRGLPIGQVLDE
jgi:hypothetical protein